MTLLQLQDILGECISKITDENISEDEKNNNIKSGMAICSLAKQMINNADVVLRADKLLKDNPNANVSKLL